MYSDVPAPAPVTSVNSTRLTGLTIARREHLNSYSLTSHSHTWEQVTGKPSTFAPSSHTHTWSQITSVPSASTSAKGIVQLSTSTSSTSTSLAATASAVKSVYDTTVQALDTHAGTQASLSQLGHVNHAVLTTTLNTTWQGSTAPYTKTQTVSGLLATDTPIVDVVMSGTFATDQARIEAWGYVYRITTANNSITLYATEKPTVSLPIQLKVVR
jgi:phage-related tail fiber protein